MKRSLTAEEEAEPLAAVADDADDADAAADVPEIEADEHADIDPVILRD